MLTDTGPLLAMLDRGDPRHELCIATAKSFERGPFITTWPCFAETMYLLGREGGYPLQAALWRLRKAGRLQLHEISGAEVERAEALMARYHDTPWIWVTRRSLPSRSPSIHARQALLGLPPRGSALEPVPGR